MNSVPEGFEIYENVGGQVFLRRKQPKLITDEELASIRARLSAKERRRMAHGVLRVMEPD